jgi:hypothetical protein|tara:strand:- start:768 stop:1034 length:267 start_codon:yes stop_codon:yes gene_type:complete
MNVHIIEDKEPTLEQLQELVGGYIELKELNEDTHLILNEEGYIRQLPINKEAMRTCQKILNSDIKTRHWKIMPIRGDVVILKGKAKLT